ncbi:DUF742 domain-containing protein [Kitasatospora sp. NPDC056783]|uniref:DUF742 domain-containing protein n=1 Tax=Kitasatospora sp. NPDC056783 TaxID=3345943 RepID=UPI00368007D4
MTAEKAGWEGPEPDRLYVITRGRSGGSGLGVVDLVTLIVSRGEPTPAHQPEHAAILRLCRSPLSVAEVSAYLELPASVVAVLLADLLDDGLVEARAAAVPAAELPERALLEAVIHGLQRL